MTCPRQSQSDHHARELRRQIIEGSDALPVLLSAGEVMTALDITPAQLKRRVSIGQLTDAVVAGARSLFRRAEVQNLLVGKRQANLEKSNTWRTPLLQRGPSMRGKAEKRRIGR